MPSNIESKKTTMSFCRSKSSFRRSICLESCRQKGNRMHFYSHVSYFNEWNIIDYSYVSLVKVETPKLQQFTSLRDEGSKASLLTLSFFHSNVFYLRELHLHVSKDMKKSHNSVPQTTVSQAFLVPSARSLEEDSRCVRQLWCSRAYMKHKHSAGESWPTCMYSVSVLKTCLDTAMALEKLRCPCTSITAFPE